MDLEDNLVVVLAATRNPLNIGAAARAMSNFGFSKLRLVCPYGPSYREARSAVGAAELLQKAQEFSSITDAVADCHLVVGTTAVGPRELLHRVERLEVGGELIRNRLPAGQVALLFGSEKRGLSREDLSHCHWLLRIPTLESHRSMNLGQAVAICLYELARSPAILSETPAVVSECLAAAGDLERLTQGLFAAMSASGYVNPGGETAALERARRLIHRMALNSDDAQSLTGILAKVRLTMERAKK